MRILLDESDPESVTPLFSNAVHDASHVADRNWHGLKNGELLTHAQSNIDVLVTTDRNLPYQHILAKYGLAVLVMASRSNKHEDIAILMSEALLALPRLGPGQVEVIRP